MDLQERKERSLAWLRELEEAIEGWMNVEISASPRWTAKSISDQFAFEPADEVTHNILSSFINGLVRDMHCTPDAITQDDIGALSELVKLRTNVEVILAHQRTKR